MSSPNLRRLSIEVFAVAGSFHDATTSQFIINSIFGRAVPRVQYTYSYSIFEFTSSRNERAEEKIFNSSYHNVKEQSASSVY